MTNWFYKFDEANSQFNRKKFLYDNGIIDINTYNVEKEKIMQLSLKAEAKSLRIKEIKELLNSSGLEEDYGD